MSDVGSRGYHVYQTTWKVPPLTDKLPLKLEPLNEEDPHAVAVIRQYYVVGHIPYIFRHVIWFIKLLGTTQVKLHSTKFYQSRGGGNGINGENGELLMGFSIFSIEIVSILCHFMPFYAIENLENLEFRKKLFLTNFQSQFQRTKVFTYYDFTS